MYLVILAALAANLGFRSFAGEPGAEKITRRSYSMDGRRWVTLFHDGPEERTVKHPNSVVSHVSTLRGRDFFEVLQTSDDALTRWTVELGATEGFGRVQSLVASAPSNLELPSFTPWVDVEIAPDVVSRAPRSKPGWSTGDGRQDWTVPHRAPYEEFFTLALGERTLARPGRPATREIVRIQSFYRQRVRQNRIEMLLARGEGAEYDRLVVERNGAGGVLDLKAAGLKGEILAFSASGDHEKVFVTTTQMRRYTFDVDGLGHGIGFALRPASEESSPALVAKPVSRAVKLEVIEKPEQDEEDCDESLEGERLAAE